MQNSDIKALCERRFLKLLEDYGIPAPDETRLGEDVVEFFWNEQKLVLKIDLDDFVDRDSHAAFSREGLAA